jgi:hypothetical protein
MAKATLFILIAVAAGLIVYFLAAPRFVHGNSGNRQEQQRTSQKQPGSLSRVLSSPEILPTSTHDSSSSVDTAPQIDVPLTSEQRTKQDLEARRGPLYAWIRANMAETLVGWEPANAEPATLDLFLARTDSATPVMSSCMEKLINPYATRFGFNHIRFYLPSPANSIDPWHIDSEATPDENGTWHLYKK